MVYFKSLLSYLIMCKILFVSTISEKFNQRIFLEVNITKINGAIRAILSIYF